MCSQDRLLWYNGTMNNTPDTLLVAQAQALCDTPHSLSAICNILALIYWSADSINWAGLYFTDPDGSLYLGPFVGKPACMEIAAGTGVVGTCASRKEPLLVPDVHAFPGHIACDSESRSEAVFPLMQDETVIAVLDIDCLQTDGITPEQFRSFQTIAGLIADLPAKEGNLRSGISSAD